MALDPGTRLGVYEILGPLGAGGMGEVYRARDTKLGREVALKILPEVFTAEPDRISRFEREARLLASVNHPGIAAIYGAEESDSLRYLVLELVPGETLAERLATGPLPVEESLEIFGQIAEALEAAHEKGIVHRDLKPSNVKITPEGKVKVLDLGLAKAMDVKSSPETMADLSQSPTALLEPTRPGVILGTAEFMSPEQARGKPVDKRADIWAFGCILYEALAGRRAFAGETVSDVFVSILTLEPDWEALPRETPPQIRELLARCLQKDPGRRLRDIGDARIEIERTSHRQEAGPSLPVQPSRARWKAPAVTALLLLLGGATLWLATRGPRAGPPRLPEKKYLVVLPFRDLSGQPNGKLVGEGMVETVSVRLSKIPGISVVAPTAAVRGADGESDPYRVARTLRANLILSGALQQDRDRMRITYSLLNTAERAQVDGGDVTGPASDLFSMQDRLAEKVAVSLKLPAAPGGGVPELSNASDQTRYLEAIGHLQRYERASSVDAAISLLEALSRERPESALVFAGLARAYFHKFDLTRVQTWADRALAACERARSLAPERPETRVTFGEILTRTGKPREAIGELERAVAALPNSAQAARGLARAYDEAGDRGRAEESYRRAVALDPGFWGNHNSLGVFYFDRGDYAKAADSFRQVTELTPDNRRGYDNLGAALQFLGRYDEARAAYEKSVAVEPSHQAYNNLGALEFSLGRYAQSSVAYEKAVRLTPDQYLLWANLGDAYRWTPGARPRSREAYERAIRLAARELRLNPASARVHGTLALCHAKLGREREARSHLDRALQLDPARLQTLYQAAVVENLSGRPREAVERLARAVAAGYSAEEIRRDPELESLRSREDFQKAMRGEKKTRL